MARPAWDPAAIERLLDFGTPENPTPLDVGTLDMLTFYLYADDTAPEQKQAASEVLTAFQNHELAWTRCHQILNEASHQYTKRFALSILDGTIQRAWRVLPAKQAEGIKEFVVQTAIELASSFETLESERTFVLKLNQVLIKIVVQEWPDKWPTFISDIVGASRSSESLCENNMRILKLLSDEVFENPGRMTEAKAQRLKDSMKGEFGSVFELCQYVLTESECPSLLLETLSTLLGFINWIDLDYVFQSDLIDLLVGKFFSVPIFRNATLKVLNEVAGIDHAAAMPKQLVMFEEVLKQLMEMVPPSVDLQQAFAEGSSDEQDFVQQLGIFLATFLKLHSCALEQQDDVHLLGVALDYMVNVSRVDDTELFKVCMEYWNSLAESLFNEVPAYGASRALMVGRGLYDTPRHALYKPKLTALRVIMVERMAKPEEVLVVEKDGEVVREVIKDTDAMEQYKFMRQTLVYLTHLDVENTELIMTEKLARQVDGSEYSWKNLNTLCWAIGSISGAMNEDHEKRFLVTVIKDLLGLCEHKRGKDHKAIIASNIMYIVGQYPRFLRAHWKFLKTVVNKLFEFMHERHEGVQDMACDTFIKIAQKCRKHFVITQLSEYAPFIDDILTNMAKIIMQLEPHQVHTFYEALGHMIFAQSDPVVKAELIQRLMESPNADWAEVISAAQDDVSVLSQIDVIERLDNVLKINIRACQSIKHDFQLQLQQIYMDMLLVYKTMSDNIANAVELSGEIVMQQPLIKGMRIIKRDILRLVGAWISESHDVELVLDHFLPPLLEAVLGDYESNIPLARDAEVLVTMQKIVTKLGVDITGQVMPIFSAVFASTLSMITADLDSFPEHRVGFYDLMHAITTNCFEAFTALSEEQFKMVMDAVVWGFRHTMRNVSETALNTLKAVFEQVLSVSDQAPEFAQSFYQAFYLSTMEDIFSVANDSLHYGDLQLHGEILQHQFSLIEKGVIRVPLNPDDASMPNDQFIGMFVSSKVKEAFPHLTDDHVQVITQGFFSYTQDNEQFVQHLRDFLVDTKEEAGEDMSSVYLLERRRKQEEAEQHKLKSIMHIGGMVAGAHDDADGMA